MKAIKMAVKQLEYILHKKEHSSHLTDWLENKRLEDVKELKQTIVELEELQDKNKTTDSLEALETYCSKYDYSYTLKMENKTYIVDIYCGDQYEEKSYIGLYLGDFPQSISGKPDGEKYILKTALTNPLIYIPKTNTVVFGSASYWRKIEKIEDFKGITKEEIENTWYIQALSSLVETESEKNHDPK